MRNWIGLFALACVAGAAPGCLTKETEQTIYLEPDGAATWTVLERNVRSDAEKAEDRLREETEYASTVTNGRHPAARAFTTLDPISVRATVLRGAPPFAVFLEARYAGFDALMSRFAEKVGGGASSVLEHRGTTMTWTFTLYEDVNQSGSEGESKAVGALVDGLEHCRFVLVAGTFVDGVGFTFSEDMWIATLQFDERPDAPSAGPIRLSLTWTTSAG